MNTQPYYKKSLLTGDTYDLFSLITIMNPKQAAFYVANGVKLQEIELSTDRKTKEPVFCYQFIREQTRDVYDLWCKRGETSA